MTRPSRAGEIFLVVFGMVFACAGIFFAGSFLFTAPDRVQGNRWVGVIVGLVFTLIGGGIIYAAISGTRKMKEQAAVEEANPETPWLWRKDWAARRAESQGRTGPTVLWVVAIFVNAIAFSVALSVVPSLWRNSDLKVFFPLGFCAVGIVIAGFATRASIRRKRFGQTFFEFAALPFFPGGRLKGAIHLRFTSDAEHGIDLRLSCVRRVVTGSGKNRSVQESVLWQTDQNVSQGVLAPGPMGDTTIPVDFVIPSDAYESCHDQLDDQVLWLLHAAADVPGVDYSDEFEVPVFRTTGSARFGATASASFSGQAATATAPAFEYDPSDVMAPASPKVVVSTGIQGGTEFYFAPFRNPGQVLLLMAFTAVWTGMIYFMLHMHAPWFFPVVFGFFDFLLIYAVVRTALGSFHVEVGDGKIVFRRALLGIGTAREIAFPDIARVLTVTGLQQQGARASYSVCLYTKGGSKVTLADAIEDRQEARWVVAQIEKLAGLNLDTHVAVQGGLALDSPPPQRARFGTGSPPTVRRNSRLAMVVGFAFFFAWAGFVGYKFFSPSRRPVPRIPKAAVAARGRVQAVVYSPLTDADMERLQTLPEQAQAEELLARSIQHDPRALEMLEQQIGGWHSLRRTPQMNDLEVRSRFSTDLRVRYANTDLNLALDGLVKSQQSAEELIAQAKGDPEHRPYSVYHMGMLAGRGVDYERLYPILVDYAKNDANPEVRQWAVEGLRFVGTDEALDELFFSFTHDRANAVRDRAGCNVSDCGNFMRKQRMRMVPGLIEIAAAPQTTAQMRDWTFLALREITDESLPADASTWREWYSRHGAEKTADFERQDWWKVRGDQ